MKLFGITGGVGMGKSTAASMLEQAGMPVVDTDRLARELVEPGQPALRDIVDTFGSSVLAPDGHMDRKAMATRVFADPAARAKLEAILHPRIRAAWQSQVEPWRASGAAEAAVVIPLLYETKCENLFDAVVCVACGEASQSARLAERGWARAEIRQRLDAQWPIREKIARADFVVWTDTTLEAHGAQWRKIRQAAARG